jgi:hypothetical protein
VQLDVSKYISKYDRQFDKSAYCYDDSLLAPPPLHFCPICNCVVRIDSERNLIRESIIFRVHCPSCNIWSATELAGYVLTDERFFQHAIYGLVQTLADSYEKLIEDIQEELYADYIAERAGV